MKNFEGLIPKKIADQCKAKDAKKNMRKAEKGYNDMTANLRPGETILIINLICINLFQMYLDDFRDWKLLLYDYAYENQERLEKMFDEHDIADPKSGVIPTDDFKRILEDDGLLTYLKPDDVKDICEKHEKERDEFDYKSFLTGKKYLSKPYLMAAFAVKKKKKKQPKKGKKQKGALPSKLKDLMKKSIEIELFSSSRNTR